MKEERNNLWNCYDKPNAVICITTNGFVKQNGEAVMGRGCAAEARLRIRGIARLLGQVIQNNGNSVHFLTDKVLAFPVKHNWWEDADLKLIEKSARELATIATMQTDVTFYLPRPGCGNGRLDWAEVMPMIASILPDNVVAVTK